jgi:hypothetical protein
MAEFNKWLNATGGGPDVCPYACEDKDGNLGGIKFLEGCKNYANCDICVNQMRPCSSTIAPTSPTRRFAGATGQPVTWRKQSGDSAGKILGLTTQQALVAVGVGVAAYFIIKKVK